MAANTPRRGGVVGVAGWQMQVAAKKEFKHVPSFNTSSPRSNDEAMDIATAGFGITLAQTARRENILTAGGSDVIVINEKAARARRGLKERQRQPPKKVVT
jgi:hypothetical protein